MKIEKFKDINPLFYVIAVVILIFLLKFLNITYYSTRLNLALNAYCNVESEFSFEDIKHGRRKETYSKESCKNVYYNKINDRIETVCKERFWSLGKRAVKKCAKQILKDEIGYIYHKGIPDFEEVIASCKKQNYISSYELFGCSVGITTYGYDKNVKKESSIFFNYF